MAPSPLAPPGTSKKWSKGDWLVKVYIPIAVPIIAALIAGGYFVFKPSSIPVLHSSYSGTYIDTTTRAQGTLTISDTSENTTTGTFTSSGAIETPQGTCFIQNTQGRITADGSMTWVVNYQQGPACNAGTADATGQLNSAGDITGTWTNTNPATPDTGTFTLS